MPEVNLRSIKDGKLIYNLESNYNIRKKLMKEILPYRRYIFVPIGNNFTVPVKLQFPPEMSHNTKYPMIVEVNGYPGTQLVQSR